MAASRADIETASLWSFIQPCSIQPCSHHVRWRYRRWTGISPCPRDFDVTRCERIRMRPGQTTTGQPSTIRGLAVSFNAIRTVPDGLHVLSCAFDRVARRQDKNRSAEGENCQKLLHSLSPTTRANRLRWRFNMSQTAIRGDRSVASASRWPKRSKSTPGWKHDNASRRLTGPLPKTVARNKRGAAPRPRPSPLSGWIWFSAKRAASGRLSTPIGSSRRRPSRERSRSDHAPSARCTGSPHRRGLPGR